MIETYRESTPFGDDVWREFDHSELPTGFVVEQVTTHRVKCARCRRFTVVGFLDNAWRGQLADHDCDTYA